MSIHTMLVDLSLPLSADVTPVTGHPRFTSSPINTLEVDGRANTLVVFSIHTATHIDAPSHFVRGGAAIDQVSLDRFYGPAVMVDLKPVERGQRIGLDLLQARCSAEEIRDRIVILWTGWVAEHFRDDDLYKANPYLDQGAALWLADQGVRLLGVDFPVDSNADGSGRYPNHRLLLGRGIPLLENLVNLERLPRHFTLAAFPVAYAGENGGNVRAVAII